MNEAIWYAARPLAKFREACGYFIVHCQAEVKRCLRRRRMCRPPATCRWMLFDFVSMRCSELPFVVLLGILMSRGQRTINSRKRRSWNSTLCVRNRVIESLVTTHIAITFRRIKAHSVIPVQAIPESGSNSVFYIVLRFVFCFIHLCVFLYNPAYWLQHYY